MLRLFRVALLGAVLFTAWTIPSCAQVTAPDAGVRLDFAVEEDLSVDDLDDTDAHVHDLAHVCDVDAAGPHLLVTATTTAGAPYAASLDATGWTATAIGGSGVASLVASDYAGAALAVARYTDDTLASALAEPCETALPAPVALFGMALTADRPSVVGGARVDVLFRGALNGDQRLFASSFTGTWSTATTLGNFLTVLPPVALRLGSSVHVIFTGTDTNLYDGVVDQTGGAATVITGATSNAEPAAVTTSDDTTYVVWQGQDTNLYWTARATSGSYSAPVSLCGTSVACLIASDTPPVLALDSSSTPVAAWLGKGDGLVYTSRFDSSIGAWSAAVAASTEATSQLPALAPGIGADDLEVVYVRDSDGQGRHVRETSGVFDAPVSLPAGALGSRPSLAVVQ